MPLKTLLKTFWGRLLLLSVASTLAGFFFATQFYFVMKAWGTPVAWEWVIPVRLWAWYLWGLLFLFVHWLAEKRPITRTTWKSAIPLHLAASLVLAAIQIVVNTWTHLTFVDNDPDSPTYLQYLASLMMFAFHRNLLIYWVMLGGVHAYRIQRDLRRAEIARAELSAHLAEARLQALTQQLQPHFLFNTLNAISALLRRNPAEADRVLQDLSDLLRMTLTDSERRAVPLARELELLERYVSIQQVRFREKLQVTWEIDPETQAALVPSLTLQPLVENSIRHAVATRYEGGSIIVSARRDGNRLIISVEDNGPGLSVAPEVAFRSGVGLSNTRERIHRMYEGAAQVRLEDSRLGGVAVRIDLPFQPSDDDYESLDPTNSERSAA